MIGNRTDTFLMQKNWEKFMLWLFPARYSEFAHCKWCGSEALKSNMFCRRDGSYFCSEGEAEEDYESRQW